MKRTLACDWGILILVCLACQNALKDNVKRWMSKDLCCAHNTESGCKTFAILRVKTLTTDSVQLPRDCWRQYFLASDFGGIETLNGELYLGKTCFEKKKLSLHMRN